MNGLGLGLGAGQDASTQAEIAAAISKSSVDTLARKRNCDSRNNHPKTGAPRISLRSILEVSKVPNSLTSPVVDVAAASSGGGGAPDSATAIAARRRAAASPAKSRPAPQPVSPAKIKVPDPLPLKQKPLWSPSAPNHMKMTSEIEIPRDTPEIDLENEIETCLKALAKQADMYHKLRSKLNLDVRCGREESSTISVAEITKALGSLGLKLGQAGQVAMVRRICATPPSDSETPKAIDARKLRQYLLNLKLSKTIKREEWDAQKKKQDALEENLRHKEFIKALAGLYFQLPESQFDSMIERYEILKPKIASQVVKKEIHARAVEWLGESDGIRALRRKMQKIQLESNNDGGSEEEEKEVAKRVKLETIEEKKAELEDAEKEAQETSKMLFRIFVQNNKRRKFEDTLSFAKWCEERDSNRQKVKEARKKWVESKDEELSRRTAAGSKVAAVADVEDKIKDLVSLANEKISLSGGGDRLKPSRQGLDLARKLREMQRLSGDGKIVSKATFDKVMHDVIFSLMADKKTAKQAKALAKELLGQQSSNSEFSGVFAEDDGGKIAERALELLSEKNREADKTYREWLKSKKRQAKKARKEKRAATKKEKAAVTEKKKKADDAYTTWLALHRSNKYYSSRKPEGVKMIPKVTKSKQTQDWQELSIDEGDQAMAEKGEAENNDAVGN